jgi:hypothetical protein
MHLYSEAKLSCPGNEENGDCRWDDGNQIVKFIFWLLSNKFTILLKLRKLKTDLLYKVGSKIPRDQPEEWNSRLSVQANEKRPGFSNLPQTRQRWTIPLTCAQFVPLDLDLMVQNRRHSSNKQCRVNRRRNCTTSLQYYVHNISTDLAFQIWSNGSSQQVRGWLASSKLEKPRRTKSMTAVPTYIHWVSCIACTKHWRWLSISAYISIDAEFLLHFRCTFSKLCSVGVLARNLRLRRNINHLLKYASLPHYMIRRKVFCWR